MKTIIKYYFMAILAVMFAGSSFAYHAVNKTSEPNLTTRYWGNNGNGNYVELQGAPDYSKCEIPESFPCILTSEDPEVPSEFTDEERMEEGYDVNPDPLASNAIYTGV